MHVDEVGTYLPERAPALPRALAHAEAEQAILGAGLIDPRAISEARAIVAPSEFALAAHGEIFAALVAMRERDEAPDGITLAAELARRGTLDRVGGREYLGYLFDTTPTADAVAHYARLVREAARRRALAEAGRRLVALAEDVETDVAVAARDAAGELLPIATDGASGGYRPMRESLVPVLESLEQRQRDAQLGKVSGIATGLREFDEHLFGFRPGEFIIFAAGPKQGKTTIVTTILRHNLLAAGVECGIVSAEMTREELTESFLVAESQVPRDRVSSGRLLDDDWPRLTRAAGVLQNGAPFHVDDEAFPSLDDVIARAIDLKAKNPRLALLAVDYLQLVTREMKGRRGDEEIAATCRGLKGLAKRLGIPVIAPAQTNYKQVDERENKMPQVRDLQGGSAMVQAANHVFTMYRPKLYAPDPFDSTPDTLEVELAASRRCAPHQWALGWDGKRANVFSRSRGGA